MNTLVCNVSAKRTNSTYRWTMTITLIEQSQRFLKETAGFWARARLYSLLIAVINTAVSSSENYKRSLKKIQDQVMLK